MKNTFVKRETAGYTHIDYVFPVWSSDSCYQMQVRIMVMRNFQALLGLSNTATYWPTVTKTCHKLVIWLQVGIVRDTLMWKSIIHL